MLIFTLSNKAVRETYILSLEELFRVGGPKIWIRVRNKLANAFPFLCMCKAMAKMLELNEGSHDGWMTKANIAGHSDMQELSRILAPDGLMLEHYRLTYIGQLFGKDDMTGRIMSGVDTEYPEEMMTNHAGSTTKCRNLRRMLQGR